MRQTSLIISLLILIFIVIEWPQSLQAQDRPTATPDAEGIIYEIVQPNDSLWAIAARAQITLPELLALNGLNENDVIQPGDVLIIGYGTPPPTPTPDIPPTLTATLPPPTATNTAVPPPRTAICLTAFTDNNGNGVRENDEPLQATVAFTIYTTESVIANYITTGQSEPYCIEGLTAGDYQVTRSVGEDETLTTNGNRSVTLESGEVVNLAFGGYTLQPAELKEPTVATAVNEEPETVIIGAQNSPINDTTISTADQEESNPNSLIGLIPLGLVIIVGLLIGGALLMGKHRRQNEREEENL
jgi:hypothetical protein